MTLPRLFFVICFFSFVLIWIGVAWLGLVGFGVIRFCLVYLVC